MPNQKIDVIVPCYNAAHTLERTINSILGQKKLGKIIIIDDASTDHSVKIAKKLQKQTPDLIKIECLARNGGVARARNWGMLVSTAPILAFLDADDTYQKNVLYFAHAVMQFRPELPMLRLALHPIGFDDKYTQHPHFNYAWRHVEMTGAGNMVIRRDFLLACGGFPQDEVFKHFGGEEVALSLAVLQSCQMGTAFDDVGMTEISVEYHYHSNVHAQRLLDTILFDELISNITQEDIQKANAVTQAIVERLQQLKTWLEVNPKGKIPLHIQFEE